MCRLYWIACPVCGHKLTGLIHIKKCEKNYEHNNVVSCEELTSGPLLVTCLWCEMKKNKK